MVGRHKWTYGVVWLWCFPLRALGQIGLTHCLPPWCSRTPLSRNTTRCVLEFLFLRAGSWHGPIIRERTIVGSRGSIVHEAAVSPAAAAAVGQLLCSEGARPRTCMRLGCLSARHCLTSLVHLSFVQPKNQTNQLDQMNQINVPPYGVFAQRNPVPRPRNDGTWISRSAARMASGPLPQEPPRITLESPVGGPVGFCDGLVV